MRIERHSDLGVQESLGVILYNNRSGFFILPQGSGITEVREPEAMNECRETAVQTLRRCSDELTVIDCTQDLAAKPDKVPARKGEVARNPTHHQGAVGK